MRPTGASRVLLRFCALALAFGAAAPDLRAQDSRPGRRRPPAGPPPKIEGTVAHRTVASKLLGREIAYAVYLPKGYEAPENAKKRWPSLYFLHGLFEGPERWEQRGGAELLDAAVRRGDLTPLVAIVPAGEMSFFVDSADGKQPYARFFFEELIPHVDATYRTVAQRERRVLMGSSMGGAGALRYAFTRGDVFAAVAAHSPAVMPADMNDASPRAKRTLGFVRERFSSVFGDPLCPKAYRCANPLTVAEDVVIDPRLRIWFDCGEDDRYEFDDGCRALADVLAKKGVAHRTRILPGGHGWDYLRSAMPDAFKFLDEALKAPPKPESRKAAH